MKESSIYGIIMFFLAAVIGYLSLTKEIPKEIKTDYGINFYQDTLLMIDLTSGDTVYKESLNSGSDIVEAILKDNL